MKQNITIATISLILITIIITGYFWFNRTTVTATSTNIYLKVEEQQNLTPEIGELLSERTRTSKKSYLGTAPDGSYKFSVDSQIGSKHYQDEQGTWQDIDPNIISSNRTNWDWEVTKGTWELLINKDTTVAIGKDGNWIGFQFNGMGYLDWQTKEYVILQTRDTSVIPVISGRTITWNDIFHGTDLVYKYESGRFKEELIISQSARDWLQANPPSSYGLNNFTTYLGGYLECDWKSAYTAKDSQGNTINWNIVNEFIDERINFWHPVKNEIISALPISYAYHLNYIDTDDRVPIRQRFWKQGNTNFLLFGAKVTELNSLPTGTIILDPTVDEQVGEENDDIRVRWSGSAWSITFTDPDVYIGSERDPDRIAEGEGTRFQNITVPQGATITTAYIEKYCNANDSDTVVRSRISGEASDNATQFDGTETDYFDDRTRTSNVTYDNIPSWTSGNWYGSVVEINSVIQEITDRAGWVSGNSLVIFWDDHEGYGRSDADAHRRHGSYNSDSTEAAKIHIEYSVIDIDIYISPTSRNLGVVTQNGTYWTNTSNSTPPSWPLSDSDAYFTLTNNGSTTVDITIEGTNYVGGTNNWTLVSGTPGVNEARMSAWSESGNLTDNTTFTTSPVSFISNLVGSSNIDVEMRLETGTFDLTEGGTKTCTITLTAGAS